MKKIIIIMVIISLCAVMSFADEYDMASNQVTVVIDGVEMSTYDVEQNIDLPAFIYESRTMLPLKRTFALFGIGDEQISWNQDELSVTVKTNEGDVIWMQINNKEVLVNGEVVLTDVPAKVFSNRTFVPVAFLSQLLGEVPQWHPETRTVTLNPSQFAIQELGVSYVLPRLSGYTVPAYDEDFDYYVIKKWHQEDELYDSMILMSKRDDELNEAMGTLTAELYLTTEDFKLLKTERISFYRTETEGDYLVAVDMDGYVIQLEVMNMTLQEIEELINSMEVL